MNEDDEGACAFGPEFHTTAAAGATTVLTPTGGFREHRLGLGGVLKNERKDVTGAEAAAIPGSDRG
jgi:hypothetical protein